MLQISDITFGYNKIAPVLDHFSIQLSKPGVYGLLGKNGTGKSTLLYLITGLLHPQSGQITFDGIDTKLRTPEILQDMFIVPEEYDLPNISLEAYIKVIKPFYPNFDEQMLNKLLQLFDMTGQIHLGALSMGQKKKIYMCIALAARTKLLVMDEPTNGLDIPSKAQFRNVVSKGMREDQIIIISTHQVRDVEQLLDTVCIIERNEVLLYANMGHIAQKISFASMQQDQIPADAIYIEAALGGYNVIMPKREGMPPAPINLEMLFTALVNEKEKMTKYLLNT